MYVTFLKIRPNEPTVYISVETERIHAVEYAGMNASILHMENCEKYKVEGNHDDVVARLNSIPK
jgi:hypothetical protein